MQNNLDSYKDTIRLTIQPIVQMLEYKRTVLSFSEWIQFVASTKARIINSPEQYLGKNLPDRVIIEQSIEMIFEEMVEEQSILKS